MLHYESTFIFLCMPVEIIFHRGHERLSDESRGKIFLCVWLLYYSQQFLLIRKRRRMVNVVLEKFPFVLKVEKRVIHIDTSFISFASMDKCDSWSFRNCRSCEYNCDDLHSYHSSLRSSHIWFSYIHNFIRWMVYLYGKSFDSTIKLYASTDECGTEVAQY